MVGHLDAPTTPTRPCSHAHPAAAAHGDRDRRAGGRRRLRGGRPDRLPGCGQPGVARVRGGPVLRRRHLAAPPPPRPPPGAAPPAARRVARGRHGRGGPAAARLPLRTVELVGALAEPRRPVRDRARGDVGRRAVRLLPGRRGGAAVAASGPCRALGTARAAAPAPADRAAPRGRPVPARSRATRAQPAVRGGAGRARRTRPSRHEQLPRGDRRRRGAAGPLRPRRRQATAADAAHGLHRDRGDGDHDPHRRAAARQPGPQGRLRARCR